MNISAQSVLRRKPGAEASPFAGEVVILDSQGRMLRGINSTGARVWSLLDGERTATDIGQLLARDYKVSTEKVLPDVLSFLGALCDRDLAEPTPGGQR